MRHDNNAEYRKPCDDNYCFFINDFVPGDAIIVRTGRRSRERGVVEFVDRKNMKIGYANANGAINKANLNDIVLLQSHVRDWLT